MNDHAGASSADRRDDFLRYLAERTETIGRRVDRFLRSGWDINGISVLRAETLRLAQASVRYDVQEVQLPLEKLAESLELALAQEALPDVELGGRVCELVQLLSDAAPPPPELPDPGPPPDRRSRRRAARAGRRRAGRAHAEELFRTSGDAWGDGVQLFGKLPSREPGQIGDAGGRVGAADSRARRVRAAASRRLTPARPSAPAQPRRGRRRTWSTWWCPATSASTTSPATARSRSSSTSASRRRAWRSSCSRTSTNSTSCSRAARRPGADRRRLRRPLQDVGSAVRLARAHNSKQRLLLVAFAEADDINLRLSARRAGVDALIIDAPDANDVIKRLQALIDPKREEPFRIMIVEDDRSQALFAEASCATPAWIRWWCWTRWT
jgi:hypothetical protein